MRRLFIWVAAIALLWSGWWALLTLGVARGADLLMQDLHAQGWKVEVADHQQGGYPLALRSDLTGLRLTAPHRPVDYTVPSLTLSAAAYWPGFLTLDLPHEPVEITTPQGTLLAAFDQGTAQLDLRPGPALQLQRVAFSSGKWVIGTAQAGIAGASDLHALLVQSDTDRQIYNAHVEIAAFAPGDIIRTALALPAGWPQAFEHVKADLSVRFDRLLDRHAGNGPLPQPRGIKLHQATLEWGEISVIAGADLTLDTQGIPSGEAALRVVEWEQLMALLGRAAPDLPLGQAEVMLRAMANMDGDPGTIDVVMAFRNGNMFLGPIALGPAPRLVLK